MKTKIKPFNNAPVDPPRPSHCTCPIICECGAIENDPAPEESLERLFEMEQKASPGPWRQGLSCGAVVNDANAPQHAGDTIRFYGGAPLFESAGLRDCEFIVALRNAARWLICRAREGVGLVNAVDRLEAYLAIEVESHRDTCRERDQARAEVRDLKADLERAQERLHRRELQRDLALKQRDHYATLLYNKGGRVDGPAPTMAVEKARCLCVPHPVFRINPDCPLHSILS